MASVLVLRMDTATRYRSCLRGGWASGVEAGKFAAQSRLVFAQTVESGGLNSRLGSLAWALHGLLRRQCAGELGPQDGLSVLVTLALLRAGHPRG